MTNPHLTEEQFTEALAGDCDFEVSRHLQMCPQCQCETKRVQAAISDFTAAGLEWAEQQAPASIPVRSRFVPRWQAVSSWTAAALVATALLFGVHQGRPSQMAAGNAIPTPERPESSADVADDNRLLAAIDTEIRWQAQSPVSIETSDRESRSQSLHKSAN
jgi:anti-sigma factor RsiW